MPKISLTIYLNIRTIHFLVTVEIYVEIPNELKQFKKSVSNEMPQGTENLKLRTSTFAIE